MGTKATCEQNFVEIIEFENSPSTKYCGDDTPAAYKARSNRIKIHFRSGMNLAGTGWLLNFMAVHENSEIHDF